MRRGLASGPFRFRAPSLARRVSPRAIRRVSPVCDACASRTARGEVATREVAEADRGPRRGADALPPPALTRSIFRLTQGRHQARERGRRAAFRQGGLCCLQGAVEKRETGGASGDRADRCGGGGLAAEAGRGARAGRGAAAARWARKRASRCVSRLRGCVIWTWCRPPEGRAAERDASDWAGGARRGPRARPKGAARRGAARRCGWGGGGIAFGSRAALGARAALEPREAPTRGGGRVQHFVMRVKGASGRFARVGLCRFAGR